MRTPLTLRALRRPAARALPRAVRRSRRRGAGVGGAAGATVVRRDDGRDLGGPRRVRRRPGLERLGGRPFEPPTTLLEGATCDGGAVHAVLARRSEDRGEVALQALDLGERVARRRPSSEAISRSISRRCARPPSTISSAVECACARISTARRSASASSSLACRSCSASKALASASVRVRSTSEASKVDSRILPTRSPSALNESGVETKVRRSSSASRARSSSASAVAAVAARSAVSVLRA